MQESFSGRSRPHSDEDGSATLVINRDTVQPAEDMESCKVCGRLTIGTHYGAAVCAFFRRTIGNGKSYQCTCRLTFRNKKKGCRHCRFKNCLKAGMDAKVVQAIKSFPQPNDTLLSQLLACRNRLYVSRGLLLKEMDAQRVETYRRHMPTLLTNHFLAIWIKLEQILATVSHGRVDKEACLSDYETIIPVTYDWAYAFCCRYVAKWASDPAVLAALILENASELLHVSWIVRRASLDSLEVTAMTQLLIAYYEREMFVDDASLQKFVNQVLRELHDHYKSTYQNYHERLGVIASIVGEFHRIIHLDKRYFTHLSLYTTSGQGMRLPSFNEAVYSLHDLRYSIKM